MTIATTATLFPDEGEQHTTVARPVLGKALDTRSLTLFPEPEPEVEPAAVSQTTEHAASIVVTKIGTCKNVLRAVADYTFPTWWRLVDLLRRPGSAEAFEHFAKSDRFLKGDKGQKVAGWRAFFLSVRATEPRTKVCELDDAGRFPDMAALAPWPLPHATRQVEKVIAGMKMQDGQWLVCLEIRLTADVGCEDWKENRDLLDACVAFCEGKEDWTDLLLGVRKSLGLPIMP
jgi:hypothetical protein